MDIIEGFDYPKISVWLTSTGRYDLIKQDIESFVEHNKLILIFEDSQKITISGKNIDTTGHKKRIKELLLMAKDDGLKIREKSVKHYAKVKDGEIVLVKW